ncbi:MAG: energy transducer TonB [Erythrobacter sp.]
MRAMEAKALRREEKTGLAVALVLHLLLAGVLLLKPAPGEGIDRPERMTVSLATEVSLRSTAPDPAAESRAAMAPELAEEVEAPSEQPRSQQQRSRTSELAPARAERNPARETPRQQAAQTPPRQAKGTQIGENFLEGSGSSRTSDDTRIPASEIGASARASLVQAISRQIKPHWNAPSGVDAELLVTELAFDLNEDGSLKGRPRLLRQSGVNDSNRPQASLHAERAIRAVQLAAPFELPAEYYNAWKSIRGARFDRNLSR